MGRRAGVTAEETREQLLAAAMELLGERGVGGVRVSEVAERAGLSTGAIYSQFGSKAELLAAAVAEHSPSIVSERVAAGVRGSVRELFQELGRDLPARAAELGPLLLEVIVTATRDENIAGLVRGQFLAAERATVTAISEGQEDGEVSADIGADALGRFASIVAFGSLVAAALELPEIDESRWEGVIRLMVEATRP